MKSILFLLAIVAVSNAKGNGLVCEVWSNWAEILLTRDCTLSILDTCIPLMNIPGDLFNFITSFNTQYLKTAYNDLLGTIEGIKEQYNDCAYFSFFKSFFVKASKCIITFKVGYLRVFVLLLSNFYWLYTGDYSTIGLNMGLIFKAFETC